MKAFSIFSNLHQAHFRLQKNTVTDNLISLKEKEKMNHEKQATDLPKINKGSDVWYCDHNKDIWEKDTVVE